MKQLIFAVESDSRAKTDDRYIYKLVLYRYNLSDKDTKHALLKDFDSPFDIKVDSIVSF